MAEISNLQESWNGHSFPEVEKLIKDELSSSGKKVGVERSGARFRVNLLDSDGSILSNSDWVSTSENDILSLNFIKATQTVKYGDKVTVLFFYQVSDANGENKFTPAGATLLVKFGTTLKNTHVVSNIESGTTTTIDITDDISAGSTSLILTLKTDDGEFEQTLYGSVNALKLTLSSSFEPKFQYTKGSNINLPYSLVSTSGLKTIDCYVDGEVLTNLRIISTSTSPSGSISIPTTSLSSGTHTIQIVAYINNNGTNVYSNSILFVLPIVNVNLSEYNGVGFRLDYNDGYILPPDTLAPLNVGLYQEFSFNYYVVDSKELSVSLYAVQGQEYSNVSTGESNVIISYGDKRYSSGEYEMRVYAGEDLVYTFKMIVSSAGITLIKPANAILSLSALNKSNDRSDYNQWTYNGVNYATFKNFNWVSDGWTNNALLLRGNASLTLACQPLGEPTNGQATQAMSIIFKLKVDTVLDPDEVLIRCGGSSGARIEITALKASLYTSTGNTVFRQFASGLEYNIGFVSHPEDGSDHDRMIYLYIDGTMVGSIRRGGSDSGETIYQTSPYNIEITGKSADLYLYSVDFYQEALTWNDMVDIYLLNINDTDTFIEEYTNNNVLDSGGQVTVTSVPSNIPYFIITGKSADGTTDVVHEAMNGSTVKPLPRYNTEEILYIDQNNPAKNFLIVGGCIRLQGTTTLIYPIKNLRIYSKDKDKVKSKLYIGVDASGQGGTLSSTHKYSFKTALENYSGKASAPVSCYVLKADCSDSSSTHNVGMATFVNTIFLKAGILTPPLKYQSSSNSTDVRIAIDGFPCYVFYRETKTDSPTFLGKFNMINDKGSEEVFGFADIKGYNAKGMGYRNYGDFKCIRVQKSSLSSYTSYDDTYPDWDKLRLYAEDYFEENSSSWAIPTYDENGDIISPDGLGNTVWDRYGFVYDDDSWAVFYDYEPLANDGDGGWVIDDGADGGTVHRHINPTECWEFATNLSTVTNEDGTTSENNSRVLFTTSEFTNTKSDGTAEWTDDFDMRYPDDDDLLLEYQTGGKLPRYLKAVCTWLSGLNIRQTLDTQAKATMKLKFMEEITNYFDLNNLLAYFVCNLLFMGVDLLAKNLMLCFFFDPEVEENSIMGKMRGYLLFYDNDTILGLRNDGYLVYSWDLDFDTIDTDQSQYAFAGYESVLWYNIWLCYKDQIKAMYQTLRNQFTLQDILDTFTKLVADKYCERIVNIDMINKYVEPVIKDNKDYLMSLHGPRTSHRTWLINNRVDMFDARYFAGDYTKVFFSFRGGKSAIADEGSLDALATTEGNVKIKTLRDWYYAVQIDLGTQYVKEIPAGGTYQFDAPIKVGQSINPLLYGLKYASSLDLSDLVWNISASTYGGTFPYLEELIFSKYGDGHTCSTRGSYANIEGHAPILKKMVACNMSSWGTMDVSQCNFLEEVDIRDSSGITALTLPSSDTLKTLRLGPGLTNLTLVNKPNISVATIQGAENFNGTITANNISNTAAIMLLDLLSKRYTSSSPLPMSKVDIEMGNPDDRVELSQSAILNLIKLALDGSIRTKSVKGYALVTVEYIYRYQMYLLTQLFPELNIQVRLITNDNYLISAYNSTINEGKSTSMYTQGMDLSILRFEIGSVDSSGLVGIFNKTLSTPLYGTTVTIDTNYPLENRISIDEDGVLTCGFPHENSSWSLDVWIHAYPFYYTEEEISQDTYEKYPGHYTKVTIQAICVDNVSIVLDNYISPNAIYRSSYSVYPTNNTKASEALTSWASSDVAINEDTGQFTAPTSGSAVIIFTYSMFGKTDADSVKSATKLVFVNSAILSKSDSLTGKLFMAFRNGLMDAKRAGVFTAFDVYDETIRDLSTGLTTLEETTSFTATNLQGIDDTVFTYILPYISTISDGYSFSCGLYLTNVRNIYITRDTDHFGTGITDFEMPVVSIYATGKDNCLFKNCGRLESVKFTGLLIILNTVNGLCTNDMFYNCYNLTDLSLPELQSITLLSNNSVGVQDRMFAKCSALTAVSLPKLLDIVINQNSGPLTELMFYDCSELTSISLPMLKSFSFGDNITWSMFTGTKLAQATIATTGRSFTLSGNSSQTTGMFDGVSTFKTINTVKMTTIPGIRMFANIDEFCSLGHTLDWSGTELTTISTVGKEFFANTSSLKKWILPETIKTCPSSGSTPFLQDSSVNIIDIRNRKSNTSWGDLFQSKVGGTSSALLFLHIPTTPSLHTTGNVDGDFPIFIGEDSSGTTLFSRYVSDSRGNSGIVRAYNASNYNDLYTSYTRYKLAIEAGTSELAAYTLYPCNWERGVSANRVFPYCMAKWMSRKVFMGTLTDENSGLSWPALNEMINTEKGTEGVEYDLDDITGNILNTQAFAYQYVETPVIESYQGASSLPMAILFNKAGLLNGISCWRANDSDNTFTADLFEYDSNNSIWTAKIYDANEDNYTEITNVEFSIPRAALTDNTKYNNAAVRTLLNLSRTTELSNVDFYLLQYMTGVTQILAGTAEDLTKTPMCFKSITLPSRCTTIGDYALCNSTIEQVNSIYNVATIGTKAFAKTNLLSIILGSMTSLTADDVFDQSTLEELEFDSLITLGTNTLRGAGSLKKLTNNASLHSFPYLSLVNIQGLGIEEFVFSNCLSIPQDAFKSSTSTSDNYVGDSHIKKFSGALTTGIGENAFRGCSSLESAIFVSATLVGLYAFYNDTSLTHLSLPSVVDLKQYSLHSCGSNAYKTVVDPVSGESSQVKIPLDLDITNVQYLRNNSFEGCYIEPIELEKLVLVELEGFKNVTCSSISLPALTSLADSTFTNSNIQRVILPKINTFNNTQFKNNTHIEYIELGTEEDIEDVTLGLESFEGATSLSDFKIPHLTSIPNRCFYNTSLTSLTSEQVGEEDGIVSLGSYAFYNTDIEEIELNSLETILQGAFAGCTSLTGLNDEMFNSKLKTISLEAFLGCTGLVLVILTTITSLGTSAFTGCTGLEKIHLGKITKEFLSLAPNCLSGIPIGVKPLLLSSSPSYTSTLGTYPNGTPVKPLIVPDLYELGYEEELSSYYYSTAAAPYNYPSTELVDRLNDPKYIDQEVDTEDILPYYYANPLDGTDRIYTYFSPWNAKDREVEYSTEGSGFTTRVLTDGSLQIIPNEDATGSEDEASVTITLGDITKTVPFQPSEYYLIFADSAVRDALVYGTEEEDGFDINGDGKLNWSELNAVTEI